MVDGGYKALFCLSAFLFAFLSCVSTSVSPYLCISIRFRFRSSLEDMYVCNSEKFVCGLYLDIRVTYFLFLFFFFFFFRRGSSWVFVRFLLHLSHMIGSVIAMFVSLFDALYLFLRMYLLEVCGIRKYCMQRWWV